MSNRSAMDWLSRGSTALLVVCAIIITGLVVRRELFPHEALIADIPFYDDWEDLVAFGNRTGPPVAPLQMVVFYDYECPFCRRVEPAIEQLRSKYEVSLAVTYRHFPLESIHLAAREAALAVECGADQGHFGTLHNVLYQNAANFGQAAWVDLAAEAGVPDLKTFAECLSGRHHTDRIERDRAAFLSVGVEAVPAIIINGKVVTGAQPRRGRRANRRATFGLIAAATRVVVRAGRAEPACPVGAARGPTGVQGYFSKSSTSPPMSAATRLTRRP